MRAQNSPELLEQRAATLLHAAAEHVWAARQLSDPEAFGTLEECLDLSTKAIALLAARQHQGGQRNADMT